MQPVTQTFPEEPLADILPQNQSFVITQIDTKYSQIFGVSFLVIFVVLIVLKVLDILSVTQLLSLVGPGLLVFIAGVNIIRNKYTYAEIINLNDFKIDINGPYPKSIIINNISSYIKNYAANSISLTIIMKDGGKIFLTADANKGLEQFVAAFEANIARLNLKSEIPIARNRSFIESNRGLTFLIVATIFMVGCTLASYIRWGDMPLRLWLYYGPLIGMWVARYRAIKKS